MKWAGRDTLIGTLQHSNGYAAPIVLLSVEYMDGRSSSTECVLRWCAEQ